MKFVNQRLFHTTGIKTGDYTCGHLNCREVGFNSFVLEDTYHEVKQAGTTRIPAGFYELKLHKEDTPLTIKHREAYKTHWFKANPEWYHIEVTGIPNYSGVYIHSGNDDSHTLGCVLPAFEFDMTKQDNQTSHSLDAVDKFYSIVYPILVAGNKVFLEVRDEIQ